MLHVTFGDSPVGSEPVKIPPGKVFTWRDPLSCGPAGQPNDLEEWLPFRAAYWGSGDSADGDVVGHTRDFIDEVRNAKELALWTDRQTDEQLLAAWTFALLDHHGSDAKVRIVDHRPVPRSRRGDITHSDWLTRLFHEAGLVKDDERSAYVRAWEAWSHSAPTAVAELAADPRTPPALAAAFEALQRRYPDEVRGLPHWEHRLLHHISLSEPNFVEAIAKVLTEAQRALDSVGDIWLYEHMRRHAAPTASKPLIVFEKAGPSFAGQRSRITDVGKAVLAGTANAVQLNGISISIGGVMLRYPGGPMWFRTSDGFVRRDAV